MSFIEYQLAEAVAEELGLLDQEYKQLKESDEELRYYTYGMQDLTSDLHFHVYRTILPRIFMHLSNKRYLLMVDNLYEPVEPTSFVSPQKVGLPPPSWLDSNWLMTTTSQEVCDRSKSVDHTVLHFSSEDEILMLVLSALHQSAKFISDRICQQDEQYWLRVALRCFHYAMLLPVQQHPPPPQEDIIHSDGDRQSYSNTPSITSDELIRQWAAQGILTAIKPGRAQENIEEEAGSQESIEEVAGSQESIEEAGVQESTEAPCTMRPRNIRDGKFFRSFYVRVAPCNANIRQLSDEEAMLDSKLRELVKKQSTYVDVHSSYKEEEVAIFSSVTAPLRRTGRHVEISAMHRYPAGLRYLLQVTRSISVTCDTSISSLHYLSSFNELEECELRWCHQMEEVFDGSTCMENLRHVHASNLKSLASFCTGQTRLSTLEHLHLEYCPRLKAMMPDGTTLPCLKTLDILFCYNLKTIFYVDDDDVDDDNVDVNDARCQLPRLQKIRLQELPRLQHLHKDDVVITAPMWKELHIRGCWSLCRLPHLQDQSRMVEVNGERSWWGKLHWDSPLHHNRYAPKLPPAFASFDEHAEVKSYLR